MERYLRKSDSVDILIFAEGTYPYVKGGVASWIHQLISGLPHYTFGIVFLGSRGKDYDGISYDLPENLKHVEQHFLFEADVHFKDHQKNLMKGSKKAFEKIEKLYKWFKNPEDKGEIPEELRYIDFYNEEIGEEQFLYSRESWKFINEKYEQNCSDISFVDYFWTVRNIHKPVWELTKLAPTLPRAKLLHSPSTGYAGFLGALLSYDHKIPFILTEHGIYIRERKIDMLTASWIEYQKPSLIQEYEEYNYIKQIWVSFFEKIGKFCYARANPIISLFNSARKVQASFGADIEKTISIPNGVNVKKLSKCIELRQDTTPHIVTLIGRVVAIKDIKTFIRAIKTVSETIPDIEGWVVGPYDEDKEYAEECFDMVKTMELEKNIKFLGFKNITEILPRTGILTLTSISEGMPLVLLEGFAAGVPCVTTNVGSCSELVHGGLNAEDLAIGQAGFVTSIANPAEMAERYLTLLNNEMLYKKFQRNAIKRVNKFYTQEEFFETYDKLYKEAIDGWHRI